MGLSKDGEATYQSILLRKKPDRGKSWIEDDMLCDQWKKRYEGLKICYAVFHHLDYRTGSAATSNLGVGEFFKAARSKSGEYLYVNVVEFEPMYFSPVD